MKKGSLLSLSLLLVLTSHTALAGFQLGDEENCLKIHGRLRPYYNYRFNASDGEKDANRFGIDQARVTLEGRLLTRFRFEAEVELGEGDIRATDLWAGYGPEDWLLIQIGQFKVPYSRERMNGKEGILFVKRPGLTQDFAPGRDIGIMCRSALWDKRFEIFGGVFTGNGPNQFKDDEKGKPLLVFRTAVSPLGRFRYTEGDLERSPRPLFSFGLNAAWSDDASLDKEGYLRTIEGEKFLYGADAVFKYMGFYAHAEVHHANLWPDGRQEYRAGGFLVQAAYLFLPPWLECALRYDEFNPSDRTKGDTQRTVTYGLNVYLYGHQAKVQVDYFQRLDLESTGEKWRKDELQILFQLSF